MSKSSKFRLWFPLYHLASFSISPPLKGILSGNILFGTSIRSLKTRVLPWAPGTHHLAPGTRGRHLELVAPFGKLCEALLNVAINLRQEREIRLFGWFPETTRSKVVDDDYYQQKFQVPKIEVLNLISLFWGMGFPYIALTYSLYRWVPLF